MGWLIQRDPVDDPVVHLSAKYNYDCDTHTLQTLDGARAGNTVYLAVRSTVKKTGHSHVFAAVILICNTRKDGFGHKDQDESMGPHQYDCPQRIMRLLSPVADLPHPGYAADWRAGVAARHDENRKRRQRRNSLRVGSTVTLPDAVRFPGGITAKCFRVAHFRRRTPIFEALDRPGLYCRLRRATLAAAAIAEPPGPGAEPVPLITSRSCCIAIYSYTVHGDVIAIIDHDQGKSVTNDAENVIADLSACFDLSKHQVIYRDTRGIWDQLLVDCSGRFTGFSSINERDLGAALGKVTRH
jgi:hypothetical protein